MITNRTFEPSTTFSIDKLLLGGGAQLRGCLGLSLIVILIEVISNFTCCRVDYRSLMTFPDLSCSASELSRGFNLVTGRSCGIQKRMGVEGHP